MAQTIRVSLASYNALTDTDPRHYALFADQDNILIKEQSRGSGSVGNGGEVGVNHALGYSPHFFVYGETSTSGRYKVSNGYDIFQPWRTYATSTELIIYNYSAGNPRTALYFIFYDNIT